jgi:hypothetical protein
MAQPYKKKNIIPIGGLTTKQMVVNDINFLKKDRKIYACLTFFNFCAVFIIANPFYAVRGKYYWQLK